MTSESVATGLVHTLIDGKPFTVLVGDEEKVSIATRVSSTIDWLDTGGSDADCRSRLSSNQAFVDSLVQQPGGVEPPPANWEPWHNPTELMLLLWVMSFGITRRAYNGIRRIVRASFSHYAESLHWPSWPTPKGCDRCLADSPSPHCRCPGRSQDCPVSVSPPPGCHSAIADVSRSV